jgi:hypothetical protein
LSICFSSLAGAGDVPEIVIGTIVSARRAELPALHRASKSSGATDWGALDKTCRALKPLALGVTSVLGILLLVGYL